MRTGARTFLGRQKRQKIGILSLGCPRNLVDSEGIAGRLNLKGYPIVDIDKADIAVVNTCAFIDEAKKESVEAILDLAELKRTGRLKKIIVYGCLPQRYRDELTRSLPEVDAFLGRLSLNHQSRRYPITPVHYAYLKICEGCVNNCSFCVVPKIKGKAASLSVDAVLSKVRALDEAKVAEINIIGQDITAFGAGLKKRIKLAGLLKKIEGEIRNTGWLRLLYLHPRRLTDELLELIRLSPKVCKYIDLPIQHINDRILKLMNRKITGSETLRLIDKIRRKVPQAALRTSIIVGFPSETDKEFKELLKALEQVKFERLGAFVYSREEGTAAYSFKKQLPQKTKLERFNAVMSLQQEISRALNKKFLGRTIEVLVDTKEEGHYLGRSQYDAPEVDGLVYLTCARELQPGNFVKARITDTLEYDLVGEVLG